MTIEKTVDGTAAMLSLTGSLDAMTAEELGAAVSALGEITDLVLDLQKLEYVSSAGLRQFALAQKRMAAKGGSFSLVRVPEFVKEVLAMTGLINHLEVLG